MFMKAVVVRGIIHRGLGVPEAPDLLEEKISREC